MPQQEYHTGLHGHLSSIYKGATFGKDGFRFGPFAKLLVLVRKCDRDFDVVLEKQISSDRMICLMYATHHQSTSLHPKLEAALGTKCAKKCVQMRQVCLPALQA